MTLHHTGRPIFTGNKMEARYMDEEDPMFSHNPFLDALPGLMTAPEVANKIRRNPMYHEYQRTEEAHRRLHYVQSIASFVEPLPLHIDLEQRFSRMIRNGYLARNPIQAEWVRQMNQKFEGLEWGRENEGYQPIIRSTAGGFAIIGTSGVGKSTAIESVLPLYPQVIYHTKYKEHHFNHSQIVWLKLDCPFDGSIKGLCLNFFHAVDSILGTTYHKKFGSRRTVDELLPYMAELASLFGLGVLVIDEIQRLSESKSGGSTRMLNFFVQLVNMIGVPVVLVGTFKALPLMRMEFAQARRASSQGDMIVTNMENDELWDFFVEGFWRYQWTDIQNPLTPAIKKAIYDESQGISDIAIKLYMLAQWSVIGQESERITAGLIREVAKEHLKLVRPILTALREKDIEKLSLISDIRPEESDWKQFLVKAEERVVIEGALNTLRNQRLTADYKAEEASPVIQIATWLVEAGVEPKIARKSAEQAVDQNGHLSDLTMVRRDALMLALQQESDDEVESKEETALKKPRSKQVYSEQDMRGTVERGKKEGKSGYESLHEAGVIRSATEFLVL